MIELLYGPPLWSRILKQAELTGSRKAAVAYVGTGANDLITFRSGDTVVFDGSPKALRCGNTNPDTIAIWLAAGADLYSYEGLHAKVLVLGRTVFVGSSNLSFNSRDRLLEAAVVDTDPDLRRMAVAMINSLANSSVEQVGAGWLDEARQLYKPPRGGQPGGRINGPHTSPTLPPGNFRLLLGEAEGECKLTAAEERIDEKERESLRKQRGSTRQYDLFGWEVGEDSNAKTDDVWVIHNLDEPPGLDSPRRVLRVVNLSKSKRMAYLRTDLKLPQITVQTAKETVKDAGGRWVYDRNFAAPAVRAALLGLWGLKE